jgi:hypothetical protein
LSGAGCKSDAWVHLADATSDQLELLAAEATFEQRVLMLLKMSVIW